jgi:hypothetical protein
MRLHEIKKLLHNKEIVSKLKRPPIAWEKISASYTSDKGLITSVYSEHKKLNTFQINDPIKKWAPEVSRTFAKKEVKMDKKYMKKCST